MNFVYLLSIWANHGLELFDDDIVYSLAISAFDDFIERILAERTGVTVFGPTNDALVTEDMLAFQKACYFNLLSSEANAASWQIFF